MSDVTLEKLSIDEFSKIAENVHLGAFGEIRPASFNRFNYALVCTSEAKGLTAYSTIIEHDAESAYMQHGGTFLKKNEAFMTVRSYLMMIGFLKENYKLITTRIFNDNLPMIKMALEAGFMITGCESLKEGTLLCFRLESDRVTQ
jgi:hypothetical protein